MKTITLKTAFADTGARNLTVSPIVLGIAGFGGFDRINENHAILEQYFAKGGNFVDTALVYGKWIDAEQRSYSELILGSWLAQDDRRSRTVISTKGAHPALGTMQMRVNAACIESDIAESFKNLGTDVIDVYFLHRDDESVPVSQIMDALNRHAAGLGSEKAGLNLFGASNWRAERIYRANDYCVQHHMRGFDVSQICFNILGTTPEMLGDTTLVSMTDAELRLYRDLDMPVMAFTSQAGGFVSRYYDAKDSEIQSRYACAETFARMRRIRSLCEAKQIPPTAATLGYLLGQELTVLPIIGVSSEAHLDECMSCADFALTQEEIAFIDGR